MDEQTVLIADDHPIFRQGLRKIIEESAGWRVVAEAETGESALRLIEFHNADIALIDIAMPVMDGIEVLRQLAAQGHPCLPIIVTSYDESAYLESAFDLGARAYLLKDAAGDDLISCLRTVREGDRFISPTLGMHSPKLPPLNTDATLMEKLTPMERTILSHLAQFKTSKEIARELDISYRTVQNHRSHICQKLEMRGTHQLMQYAARNRYRIEN